MCRVIVLLLIFYEVLIGAITVYGCQIDTLNFYNGAFTISPDGKSVLQIKDSNLYVMNVDTREERVIDLKNEVIGRNISIARGTNEFAIISVSKSNAIKLILFDWTFERTDVVNLAYLANSNLFHLEYFPYFYRANDSLIFMNYQHDGFIFKNGVFSEDVPNLGVDLMHNKLYQLEEILEGNGLLKKQQSLIGKKWQIHNHIFFYLDEATNSMIRFNLVNHEFEKTSFFDYVYSFKGKDSELFHSNGKLILRRFSLCNCR